MSSLSPVSVVGFDTPSLRSSAQRLDDLVQQATASDQKLKTTLEDMYTGGALTGPAGKAAVDLGDELTSRNAPILRDASDRAQGIERAATAKEAASESGAKSLLSGLI